MRVRWRNTGMVAMALLVCGCVLAALAGPAQSVRTRTQALQQTLGKLPRLTKTIQVSAALSTFDATLQSFNGQAAGGGITADTLTEARDDMTADFAATPLPLGKGAWSGLTVRPTTLSTYSPHARADLPPQLEPLYRDTLLSNVTLLAGRLSAPATLAPRTLAVCVTDQTAARFVLRPGSVVKLVSGQMLLVTGIIRVRDGGSPFWTDDPVAAAPGLNSTGGRPPLFYWVGGVIADPGQFSTMLTLFGESETTMQWEFPVDPSRVTADQVDALQQRLNRAVSTQPALSADINAAGPALTVRSPLLDPVAAFAATQQAVLAVLLLMFVSLIMVGAAVIVLAARMIVARRDEELALLRARGAASWQVAALTLRHAAVAAIPAAAAGIALSMAVAGRDRALWLGWPLAAFVAAVALAGPPGIALWRHRRPAPPVNRARVTGADPRVSWVSARALRRLVAEAAACAAAAGGLAVLHGQGVPVGSGINWYLTVTPILVAVPAVVLTLRLYPLVVRGLLRLAARRAGAASYVALASSSRTSLAAIGPAFALVLALSLATFAGMVNDAIDRGQDTLSWQQAGADVVINRDLSTTPITPAAERAIAAVPGVTLSATVWHSTWLAPGNQALEVAAVDPVSYAALTARTPFPAISARDLAAAGGAYGAVVNQAGATLLGRDAVTLTPTQASGQVSIRVATVVGNTPAVLDPATPFALIQLPDSVHQQGSSARPDPDQILLVGSGIDRAKLDRVLGRLLPGWLITYRADLRAALHGTPLSHGAQQLMLLTVLAAAGLGLVNLILGLALGAADRDLVMARLAVMGFAARNRLVIVETLPAIIAALIAGLGCALALPVLAGSALDLSVFTGSSATVQLSPGFAALGDPAAALILLALAILVTQTWIARRRGATGLLRAT